MAKIENIILHCSDSEWGNAKVIDGWHRERGWSGIGYHFVVLNGNLRPGFFLVCCNGSVEAGRPLGADDYLSGAEIGAHAMGFNSKSIGVCMIGTKHFNDEQMEATRALIRELMLTFEIPVEKVLGHYEIPLAHGKTCPNINMDWLRKII